MHAPDRPIAAPPDVLLPTPLVQEGTVSHDTDLGRAVQPDRPELPAPGAQADSNLTIKLDLRHALADPGPAVTPTALPVTPSAQAAASTLTEPMIARHSEPPSPIQQTAAIIAAQSPTQPGSIDLTLTPETLGRLHFEMRPEGDKMAITLSAERPETLDLVRRHLPDLLAELKQAGVQAGTLSFGTWSDGRHPSPPPPEPDIGPASFGTSDQSPAPIPKRPLAAAAGGLDLRF